jgi:hypothetical protein
MARLTDREKHDIQNLMLEELNVIRSSVIEKFEASVKEKREALMIAKGIEDRSTAELGRLDVEIAKVQEQCRVLGEKLEKLREDKRDIERHRLGEWSRAPTPEQLTVLGTSASDTHKSYNEDGRFTGIAHGPAWNGVPIQDRLDAEACLLLHGTVVSPAPFFDEVAKSLVTAFAFVTSPQDAREVYDKFRALKFERFGASPTRTLGEMKTVLDDLFTAPALPPGTDDPETDDEDMALRRKLIQTRPKPRSKKAPAKPKTEK